MQKKILMIPVLLLALSPLSGIFASGAVPYVLNLPTHQTIGSKMFLADVGHRYIDVNRHTTNINIALTYGILSDLDATVAYSFLNKDMIGSLKYNLLNDFSGKHILSLSFLGGGGYKDTNQVNNYVSLSAADDSDVEAQTTLESEDRPSGFFQVIVEKHFFDNSLSIGVVPSFAYNTNFYQVDSENDYSAGLGVMAAFFFTDSIAVCGEVVMNIAGFAFKYMNYNCGFKYAGYRHTFSLWVSNSNGYSPVEYMTGSEKLTPKFSAAFTREFDIF